MKANTADCIRKAINISNQKDFFKFDKNSFDASNIKKFLPITSPKLVELINNIYELDNNDFQKYGTYFKHIIYSDVKTSIAGIKLVASALTAYGMNNIYNNKFNINIPDSNYNFALLSSLSIYDKPITIKLRNDILNKFNERPSNIYGKFIRFLLIDQGFKEGIDVFDVKYVHLVDDLLSKSDEKQAIGRGTRFCGQKGLDFHPQLGWPLHVFKYKLIIDENKYGFKYAFDLYLKHNNININKLNFAAELENICRFGSVDYEINKAIHNFGNDINIIHDNLFLNFNDNFQNFKLKDPLLSLEKENNNDFKLLKLAYKNFGGKLKPQNFIKKNTKKFINIKNTKQLSLNNKLDFFDMRLFIRKNFNSLKWNNLEFKNNCISSSTKNRIITLNNTQSFVSSFFTAESFYKGILFWHSVGTGKTCSAIATASNSFENNNYTILWVTRHTLKPDIWKNIFKEVCSFSIKQKLNNGIHIPEDVDSSRFKYLDNKWIEPLSYKQFTNLINKKNIFYDEMIKRNGLNDPFFKTLIIIDEAHKLYADDTPINERPDINALKKAIYNSYSISGKNSCKLILMTATPFTNDPMQLFKLLNLLRHDDFFPEDFDSFKNLYLNDLTFKFNNPKAFLDKISGYISYVNREKDVRQFAYPVIYDINVNMTSNNLSNDIFNLFNDFIPDIQDFLNFNNDFNKSFSLINNLKKLSKNYTSHSDIISQEEAFDTCLNHNKKKSTKNQNLIDFNNLINSFDKILKNKQKKRKN